MTPNELSELAPIAKTLNQQSNEINQTISALNDELAALNLGIEVWLDTESESDPECKIGFAKIYEGNETYKWQLATRRKFDGFLAARDEFDDEEWDVEPLLKASRDLRIEGLQNVSRIIFLLKREAEAKIAAIKNAKQLVSELSVDRRTKS